jgi:ER-bound oxygenase mpaB/B'/Rubber oxygenase, catalytic domain
MEWTDADLDRLALTLDPPADRAAELVYTTGWRQPLVTWLRAAHRDADPLPDGLPAEVREFFEITLPAWADPHLLRVGQGLFLRYPVPMLQTLLVRSLPEVYAGERIATILGYTQRLEAGVPRRFGETLQFFFDVASPEGFSPEGRGIRTTLRVRLLHAAIRHMVPEATPINQEDLAATLVTFSAFILEGMEAFGIDLSPEEEAGWMHLWAVTGVLLGLQLHFATRAEALAFFAHFRRRQQRRTAHGVALTAALLDFCDSLLPGTGLDGLNPTVFRFLSGDALADLLGVGPADATGALIGPYQLLVAALDEAQDHSAIARSLATRVGRAWVQGVIRARLPDGRATFALPDHLGEGLVAGGSGGP